MDPVFNATCIAHVRHCMAYKKVIMIKVLDPNQFPLVIDKQIFTYIGFFPILIDKYKIHRPLRFKHSDPEGRTRDK
jgi:hypothetical protein